MGCGLRPSLAKPVEHKRACTRSKRYAGSRNQSRTILASTSGRLTPSITLVNTKACKPRPRMLRAKAQKRGTASFLAEARLQQSLAASRLNDPKSAVVFDEEAQEIYKQVGDNYGLGPRPLSHGGSLI